MPTPEQIAKRMTYDPVFAIGESVRDMMAAHIAHAIRGETKRLRDALQYIAEREPLTFAECSVAEQIISRAKAALNPE